MSAIQNGAGQWIDGFAQLSGGQIGSGYQAGAMNGTSLGANPDAWGTTDDLGSLTSVISDLEEEGQVETTHEESEFASDTMEVLSDEIAAGCDELSASDEIVAAVAAHIGVIEATMRRHQSAGIAKFAGDQNQNTENPCDESFGDSLIGDMLQDPAFAFAVTIPSRDRLGILSLLS